MYEAMKAGIVCCSDGLPVSAQNELRQLKNVLEGVGMDTVFSSFIYAKSGVQRVSGKQRGMELMGFYERPDIDVIFDVSGGDIANEILPYLDYDRIAESVDSEGRFKQIWGYSDLTVVLNAIYAKTGRSGVLYQVRHLTAMENKKRAQEVASLVRERKLTVPQYSFLQGERMSGIVVGGNIRCFLKLAGTEYFPDMTDKILLLEARSGLQSQMTTYLSQLKQLGVFRKVNGILLGTFTEWEQLNRYHKKQSTMEQLVKEYVKDSIPIVETCEIGHAVHAAPIWIGERMEVIK